MSRMTEEMKNEFQEMFTLFDVNHNGIIPLKDLGTLMRSIGSLPTESTLKDLLRMIEEEYEKRLDFNCFLKIMERQFIEIDIEQEIINAFLPYDIERNGYISITHLESIMESIKKNHTLSDEEVSEMIKGAFFHTDGNGLVNYQEFVKMLLST